MPTIALGLVGYYQFIRGYPLGPELKERLDRMSWPGHQVDIKEMNWGPVAIVQDFQASDITYDRVVLVAAVQRGGAIGSVKCRNWVGGELAVMEVQNRIFEAVTGIISVDNLLVIGEHFGIWPKQLIVIEVELPNEAIGNLVLEELNIDQSKGEISAVGQQPITPEAERVVEEIASLTDTAIRKGVDGISDLVPLSVKDLNPLADICHNQLINDVRRTSAVN